MKVTKTIQNTNRGVIAFIKAEISKKKERHAKLMQSINPHIIDNLKKMGKVES